MAMNYVWKERAEIAGYWRRYKCCADCTEVLVAGMKHDYSRRGCVSSTTAVVAASRSRVAHH